jgi:D-3-phosphoglycerate dehydrogenase
VALMKVLIADKFEAPGVAALRAAGCEIHHDPGLDGDSLLEALGQYKPAVVVVRSTRVTKPMLEATASLKLVLRAGAGTDTIDKAAATERGIAVANCPGTNSAAVAELVMGLMLALDRRIPDNVLDLRLGKWKKQEYSKARGIKGRTLGIVEMGRIGRLVAKRAAAFDMTIIYSDIIPAPDVERELGARRVEFNELLAVADVITLHVPMTDDTKTMIGREQLAKMKPGAYLINTSRGGVIDYAALTKAIRDRGIRVALDVYGNEPIATAEIFEDPIVKAEGVVYGTHHIGASTEQAQLAVAEEAVRVITEFKKTGEILNRVN